MAKTRADVVVVGGGPGGSTAATFLARNGYDVVLLERERFPRDHVGESLLPASVPVLKELGVLPLIEEEGFLRKWGATMVWGRDSVPWSWYFRETNRTYPHAYQVWRPRFDQILLDNARAEGVDVREGRAATGVLWDEGAARGVRYRTDDGSEGVVEAEFLLDASGQAGLVSRALGLRRWDTFFRNLAVYGYYRGAERLPDPDETNIFIESYPGGWTWNIPLANGLASVGAVVDSDTAQRGIADSGLSGFFEEQVGLAPHTSRMLAEAELASGPFVVKDWSYTSERLVGDGWVLLGDAACFVDPLFSSGVHLALMSAVLAAAYVHAVRTDVTMRGPAAEAYGQLYRKEYLHFRELARLFYATNRTVDSYFWEARRIVGGEEESPRESFIRAVAGQPPEGYERVVLGHGVLPPDVARTLDRVETDRSQRAAAVADGLSLGGAPRLAEGCRLDRAPVFADGEFQWSAVLATPDRPEGVALSDLVAKVVSLVDGRRTVGDVLHWVSRGVDGAEARATARESTLTALTILYIDGAIEDLVPPG